MHGEDSARVHDRIFTSRTASFRRADSLKSVEAVGDGNACIFNLSPLAVVLIYDLIHPQGGLVPTAPATPVPKARGKTAASARPLIDPVPVSAPLCSVVTTQCRNACENPFGRVSRERRERTRKGRVTS